MTVFAAFSYFVMKERLTMNYLYAALCMVARCFSFSAGTDGAVRLMICYPYAG